MINLLCIKKPEVTEQNPDNLSFNELAEQLEVARSKILSIMVDSNHGLLAMAQVYIESIENKVSPSDLFSSNLSDKLTDAENNPKSATAKQTELKVATAFNLIIQDEQEPKHAQNLHSGKNSILNIHFLPSFLIQVANRIVKDSSNSDSLIVREIAALEKRIGLLRSKMVTSNIGLVKFMARQYRTQHMSFEDLQQEGIIGLIKAVDRFDHTRQLRFSTYATYWVRQTIARSMSKNEKLIRIPINLAPKAPAVFQMMEAQFIKTNRWPNASDLAKLCEMTEDEISTILDFYRPTVSLDGDHNDDETTSMIEYMEQDQFPSAIKTISDDSLKENLQIAINALPEKEASVICCRYGLGNQAEMTLQDIANRLRVTRERVRQIQNSGLKKLNLQFGCQLNAFLETE